MTVDEARAELGIDESADRDAMRRAYLALLKTRKPERDPEGFQRLREAYEILSAKRPADAAPTPRVIEHLVVDEDIAAAARAAEESLADPTAQGFVQNTGATVEVILRMFVEGDAEGASRLTKKLHRELHGVRLSAQSAARLSLIRELADLHGAIPEDVLRWLAVATRNDDREPAVVALQRHKRERGIDAVYAIGDVMLVSAPQLHASYALYVARPKKSFPWVNVLLATFLVGLLIGAVMLAVPTRSYPPEPRRAPPPPGPPPPPAPSSTFGPVSGAADAAYTLADEAEGMGARVFAARARAAGKLFETCSCRDALVGFQGLSRDHAAIPTGYLAGVLKLRLDAIARSLSSLCGLDAGP